jgi:hypothetical protein
MQLVYTWWRKAKTLGLPQHALKRSDLTGHQQLNPKVHASSSFHLAVPFEDTISGCYTSMSVSCVLSSWVERQRLVRARAM